MEIIMKDFIKFCILIITILTTIVLIHILIKGNLRVSDIKLFFVLIIIIVIGSTTLFLDVMRNITYVECRYDMSGIDIDISESDKLYVSLSDFNSDTSLAHVIIGRDGMRVENPISMVNNKLIYEIYPNNTIRISLKEYLSILRYGI